MSPNNAERQRLDEDVRREKNWKRWGPYLAERQWGTVREDYSADGDPWSYFPHDHARSRAYRWGEDGLLGFTDRQCRLCFGVALWNEEDPYLKERLFGLTGPQGNHGEDVKELYYYVDSTPTHSYCKALYKYPQAQFPYRRLHEKNRWRDENEPEYELSDTGIFRGSNYFDVQTEYAKASPDDVLIRITVTNRSENGAMLHLLPTLWFRNTWIWGCEHEGCTLKPRMSMNGPSTIDTKHPSLGRFSLTSSNAPDGKAPEFLFTENESNTWRLWDAESYTPYVKDAFHEYVIHGRASAVNPNKVGTKATAHYLLNIAGGESATIRLRLYPTENAPAEPLGNDFDDVFAARTRECDEFYREIIPEEFRQEEEAVQRQAYAGLLWNKQFYHFSVHDWLRGDPDIGDPPTDRGLIRNGDWENLFNRDIISMPDKWEYPWYAAWDLAFHMIPFAQIDPTFAKEQLLLFLREWYMHPNGQIPAYEWEFSDVNPPVHAWACWRVYKMTAKRGQRDISFLARAFQKLLINFTWWVNRKDPEGRNIFAGGFLGMDNIGVFDRSAALPTDGYLAQSDGTAWMAFYCSTMLAMALELATHDKTYEDVASKFFEHFVAIADAMNTLGGTGLWDEEDGFYYDHLVSSGDCAPMRLRSMVGLVPLFAVEALHRDTIDQLPGFKKRMNWFLDHRKDLAQHISWMKESADGSEHQLLAIPSRERLERVLRYLLDESEFLSEFGIRSLSKYHEQNPFIFEASGEEHIVRYVPGESDSRLFGGNSNWRGPVWFPVNFLLIEALEKYDHFYGDRLTVEFPTGSSERVTLGEAASRISRRLTALFIPDEDGQRPSDGGDKRYATDPNFKDLLQFYEYFNGNDGKGLGASHQTGWTALVAKLQMKYGSHTQ